VKSEMRDLLSVEKRHPARVMRLRCSDRPGDLICRHEGIMALSYEKANPPRGGGAKPRASRTGGSRVAERRHYGAFWPILRTF
jgi:hypothetical protein